MINLKDKDEEYGQFVNFESENTIRVKRDSDQKEWVLTKVKPSDAPCTP